MSTAIQKTSDFRQLQQNFERDGYIVLHDVLDAQIVNGVRSEMEQLTDRYAWQLQQAGKANDLHENEPLETRLYSLYRDRLEEAPRRFREELHSRGMFPLLFHPVLLDIMENMLGPEIRLYPNYTVRPKFPEWGGHQVLWHQDGGYTEFGQDLGEAQIDDLRMVNVWTPLVPVNVENGCMQFIPGTHHLGAVPHEEKQFYLEIVQEQLAPLQSQAIDMVLQPGDVVLFHNMLFHQGLPNNSKQIRWSVDWRYQDANQPTLRAAQGHIARSRSRPESAVKDAAQWAGLSFV